MEFEDGIGACAWPLEFVDPVKGRTVRLPERRRLLPGPLQVPRPQAGGQSSDGGLVHQLHPRGQASVRVIGPASVMSQAAGTAAALSIKQKVPPRMLDMALLRGDSRRTEAFLG